MERANITFLAGNRSASTGRSSKLLGTAKRMEAGWISSLLMRTVAIGMVAVASLVLPGGQPVQAQQSGEPAGQQSEQPSSASDEIVVAQAGSPLNARRAVIDGIKSYEAGKYANAVTSLSIALQGEGLTSKDTAKALYYRGRAHKQLKKFPEAIADLTSALWLKDGLSDAERQRAEADRKASYASVGVASPATVARANASSPATPAAPVAPAKPAAAAAAAVPARTKTAPAREIAVPVKPVDVARPARKAAAAPAATADTNWTTSVGTTSSAASGSAPQVPTRTAALSGAGRAGGYSPDSSSDGLVGFPTGTAASVASSPSTAAAAPAPAAPASPLSNPFKQVGSFFSNMTNAITGGGSSSSGTTAKPAPDATASTSPAAATSATTAVSAWNSGTQVAANAPAVTAATQPAARPAQQTAALAPAKPAAKVASPTSGKFRLQLAAVRSRNEAERLARDLASRHRSALGSYVPEIDETVYGNMGTFYRVQVGPFASASEPQSLCNKIKSSGFDCLITGK